MNNLQITASTLIVCLLLVGFHFSGQSLGRADAEGNRAETYAVLPLVLAGMIGLASFISLIFLVLSS